jgi:hypothetical protein
MAAELRTTTLLFRLSEVPMHRKTSLIGGFLLGLTPCLFGQQAQIQPTPQYAEDILAARQLVAWTSVQKPRPVPQPLPPPDKGVPQADPQTPPPAPPQGDQQKPTQTFTGKIVKDGEKYVLKAGGTSYQLDDQNDAKQYQEKDVKIVGTIDPGSNTIHIVKIELIS